MVITEELLKKYARLIVRVGVNVQKDQVVMLNAAVEQSKLACYVVEECYLAGAKRVDIDWTCDRASHLAYKYAETETLGEVLTWQEEKMKQWVNDLPCRIFLVSDDPDALAGLDVDKISTVGQMRRKVMKPYRDAIDGKHQWTIAAVPSVAWAKKCFPELSEEDAIQKLWDAILGTCRVSEDNDPVAEWKAHTDFIKEKSKWLNAERFRSLRYSSANGTDFTVDLIPDANWEGAAAVNNMIGAEYVPNMPTEEIFTSPIAGKCEGTLVSTKPLAWNGQVIDGFSITFENGRAVSCKAAQGQALLEKMLHMDETAGMLGEVALVPKESPVNQCGFLFYETLFDENACCHFAVGAGFKEVLPDGDDLTVEEAAKRGINDSLIHVDFMVGSDDLSIIGIKEDGTEVPVFVDGTWAK